MYHVPEKIINTRDWYNAFDISTCQPRQHRAPQIINTQKSLRPCRILSLACITDFFYRKLNRSVCSSVHVYKLHSKSSIVTDSAITVPLIFLIIPSLNVTASLSLSCAMASRLHLSMLITQCNRERALVIDVLAHYRRLLLDTRCDYLILIAVTPYSSILRPVCIRCTHIGGGQLRATLTYNRILAAQLDTLSAHADAEYGVSRPRQP